MKVPRGIERAINNELASRRLKNFILINNPGYDMQPFHEVIISKLDAFERGEIQNLIINMPPQHGKSLIASINFPAYAIGKNPKRKIAVCAYEHDFACDNFATPIRSLMQSEGYRAIFPNTTIKGQKKQKKNEESTLRRDMIKIDGGGQLYFVGVGGGITGRAQDIIILDDTIKGAFDAYSTKFNAKRKNWLTRDVLTRISKNGQILVVCTRWTPHDIPAIFIENMAAGGRIFEVITFPAIKEGDENDYDQRKAGEALWPERFPVDVLLERKKLDPVGFQGLYQQKPEIPTELLIYSGWQKIKECDIPEGSHSYGLDFGDVHPTAMVEVTETEHAVYLHELYYKKGQGITQMAIDFSRILLERAKRWHPQSDGRYWKIQGDKSEPVEVLEKDIKFGGRVWADSAAPTIIRELRQKNINVVAADKGPGSVMGGILSLKSKPVYYTEESKNLEFEYQNYRWEVDANGNPTQEVVKEKDDLMDAFRYAMKKAATVLVG